MGLASVFNRLFRKTIEGRGPLSDFWYSPVAASSKEVTPWTAMNVGSYWACLANISEDMAKFPIPVYRKVSQEEREQLPDHHLASILNTSFNPDMTAFVGRQTLTQWAMGWGNGYAEIARNGIGRPVELWPIHPSRVVVKRNPLRQLVYEVKVDGYGYDFPARDIFHIVGRLSDDGISGISIAAAGSQSISRGSAIQDYSTSLFNAGMSDRVALKHPGKLQSDTHQKLRASWVSLYGGTEGIERGPAILQEGMDVVRIGIPPKDAQMLDESEFTPEDIARWFRMPLSKIGSFERAQGWSTLEAANKDYINETLMPWDIKWQQEAKRKLFTAQEDDLYIGHNFDALLQGDVAARSEFFTKMFRLGLMNRNEIRALEDMNPVDGGDVYFIESSNLQPLGDDGLPIPPEVPDVETPQEPAEKPQEDDGAEDGETTTGGPADDNNMATIRTAAEAALAHSFQRLARKEAKAIQGAIHGTLEKGRRRAFETWTTGFYGQMAKELRNDLLPCNAIIESITGITTDFAARCEAHAEKSRLLLMAALERGGTKGVNAQLGEWERQREFYHVG